MSVALKNFPSICHSCLRFTHVAGRISTSRVLPRRALIHSTHKLATPVKITRQIVGDFGPILAESPTKFLPPGIITLKEHLDSGDLSAACAYLMGIETSTLSPEELGVPTSPPEGFEPTTIPRGGSLVPHAALQKVIGRLFVSLMKDGAKVPNVPQPLELLKKMEDIGVAQTSYYTDLLMATIKDFESVEELLAVFDATAAFNSENLQDVMTKSSELNSLSLDTATPHFIAFLILRDLNATSEFITRIENVIRHSPCPTPQHIGRFLDHHQFPLEKIDYILNCLESYTASALFTNFHTFTQEISRASTPEALKDLYTRILASPNPPTAAIYTKFVTSFIELRCHSEGLACWEDMISSGVTPSAIQWNELMKAFSKGQDKRAMLSVWDMMLKSGCIPDHHCWTTRIHALLDGNNISQGLQSLREMQAFGVLPTTGTINAVVKGLLKHGYFTEAEATLGVAEKLGIKKDLWTYNTILRSLVKQQKTDSKKFASIIALVKDMQANDIVPDIKTATLILDGMYKYSTPRPTLGSVMGFLTYLESSGIGSNIITYTAILHALLEENNESAAMGLLTIMQSRGVMPNSATYTVFLKYYFSRSDLVSVDHVLAEIVQKGIQMDDRMYREIAYGFAATRQVHMLKKYLAQMYEKHVFIGLTGYMSVLRMLEKQGMLLDAKNLVVDLLERGAVGKSPTDRGRTNESGFWEVVRELGNGAVLRELKKEGSMEA